MKRLLNSALSYLRGRPEAGTKRRTPARTRPRLRLEPLEDRSVPSATLVRDINETLGVGSVPDRMTAVGSRLYFLANDGANGRDLWTSDGTEAGTRLLRNFYPSGGATSFPSNLTPAGSQLFFTADDGTSGEELWVTDGTPAGTRLLDIRRGGSGSGPGDLTDVNGVLYFTANDGFSGDELWRSDGTVGGTRLVRDIGPLTSGFVRNLTNVNGVLYFSASDGGSVVDTELWRSDGTEAGTRRVRDINPTPGRGSHPRSLMDVNGVLYFVANDGSTGEELWTSDGTFDGTRLVRDIRTTPGATSLPSNLTAVGSRLFFTADDGMNGRELWITDGTFDGTRHLDINPTPGSGSGPSRLTDVNGVLFFTADDGMNGRELWVTDGTPAGTRLVRDIRTAPRSSSVPDELTVVGSQLYFTAYTDATGQELWTTDGTFDGTRLVRDINPVPEESTVPGSSYPLELTVVGSRLYFYASDWTHGGELWTSDGTEAGTTLVHDIVTAPRQGGNPSGLINVNGVLFFTADDVVHGRELWRVSGDTGGLPSVGFTTAASAGPESTTRVSLTVTLSAASAQPVAVTYRVTGGTAARGTDYTLADGTLTFDPGQTTRTITIDVVDDALAEGDETVQVTLSDPVNADLGPIPVHTYTIRDDDQPGGGLDLVSGPFGFGLRAGAVGSDFGSAVATDAAGNVYVVGGFQGTVDFDPGPGTVNLTAQGTVGTSLHDAFVAKYSPAGVLLWARRLGGSGDTRAGGAAVDGAGNVYVTGYFTGTADFDPDPGVTRTLTSAGPSDAFVAKLTSGGTYLWAKQLGGSDSDSGADVAVDGAGNVYVTGGFRGTADFDPDPAVSRPLTSAGNADVFVAKLNPGGTYLWAGRLGGAGFDHVTKMAVDGSGGVWVTGSFQGTADFDPDPAVSRPLTSAGGDDAFVAKLTSGGGYLWAGRLGGQGGDRGTGVAVDGSGNVYVAGTFGGTADFDPDPAVSRPLTSAGGGDVFVAKLTSGGTYLWAKQLGGTGSEQAARVAADGSGGVYVTGSFQGTADFDPDPSVARTLTSAGDSDAFVAKLGSGGNYLWAHGLGSGGYDIGYAVAVDGTGNVFTTGSFAGTADFDPGPDTRPLTSADTIDVFVWKLTQALNRPPVLAPIADRSVPSTQDVVAVPLSATDPDGDSVTFSATAQSLAYVLDQQLGLTFAGDLYENFGGRGEKWLLGTGDQWYFVLPSGELYRWDGNPGANGTLVGNVGASYHADPSLLYDAQPGPPPVALIMSGSTLTIDWDDGFVGSVVVTVTASDGRGGTDTRAFTVTVTSAVNRPPALAPVADRTVLADQTAVSVPLSAADPDGDPVTFTAAAQSLAYVLRQQYGISAHDPAYDNYGGRGEKWFAAAGDRWLFLLPGGELYLWDGGAGATGSLLGHVGASYHQDPARLVNAPADQPRAALSVSGSTLTITRDPAWVSGVVVTVTASDGRGGTDTRTFTLTVTAAPAGLVAWWRADGTAADSAGSHHGALRGGAAFAPGRAGQAFFLDGVDDYVEVPDAPALGSPSVTVAAWVSPAGPSAGRQTVASKYDSLYPNGQSWLLDVGPGGSLRLMIYQGNRGTGVETAAGLVPPGAWRHVAGTFDHATGRLRLYVDGAEVATTAVAGSQPITAMTDSATPVRIGTIFGSGSHVGPENMWRGLVDELSLYNRALTPDEVRAVAAAGGALP